MLAGCSGAAPPTAQTILAPARQTGSEGRIEWRATLPCADCDGIDTQLVLQRGGTVSQYTLTETYLAAGQGARFVDHGRWQRQLDMLQLQGDSGSQHMYALLPDGRLQPRDRHGQRLSPRADDWLVPVASASDQ